MNQPGLQNGRRLTIDGLSDAARFLATRDPDLAGILEKHDRPPLWGRRPGFATLVRIILEQQVSLASARAIFMRLTASVTPFTPEQVFAVGESHLRSLGLTRQKAAYCWELARTITCGELSLVALSKMDDQEAKDQLMRIKGVGSWTADIYLLMALRRPDVWPSGDLALAQSVVRVKRLRSYPGPEKLEKIAEAWRPFRSVAARMLWQHYLARREA
jgi:DNA-3-methyladenine glycosylase II